MKTLLVSILLLCATTAAADAVLCPYDVALDEDGKWVRTLSLYKRLTELQTERGIEQPWAWSGDFADLEVAGNRALTRLPMSALSAELQADILDPGICNCQIVEDIGAVKHPARAPRLVDGVVTFDDEDTTRDYITPEQFGLSQRHSKLSWPAWFARLFGVRQVYAQLVNGILDTFNRADENPLAGGGNWGLRIDSDTDIDECQLLSNAAARGNVAGICTSYWDAATFTNPEVYVTHNGGAAGNRSELHIVYLDAGTTTPSGYKLGMVKQAAADVWQLTRLDGGILTIIGVSGTTEVATGDELRLSHASGVLIAQHCPTTCTTVRTEGLQTTYSGAARIGLGVNSTNITLDDFGGGSLVTGKKPTRRFILW